ncbi:MAG: hypothetical protein EAX90_13475 [Candidatus Heimdallarchaeota archaeon]|nr:hypothetical protein [Candidatus Heimdallarchaeota archaeon]
MKRKIKFSLIIAILTISIFLGFTDFKTQKTNAATYTITNTFTDMLQTYFEEISITNSPAMLHLRFEYLGANEPSMVMQVYNITGSNNTQMWSDSEKFHVMRFESNIDLNITVTSTDDEPHYPADFRLRIFVNQIDSINDQEDYIWTDNLYFSGDVNYLKISYSEITSVNIHTVLNQSILGDLYVKAKPIGEEYWFSQVDSTEDESHLSFQIKPGETWELYIETMGDPTKYPLEFTVTISTTDRVTVNTQTAEFSSYLTMEEPSHLYEIPITTAPSYMRLYCIPDYTIYCDIYNTTESIYQTYVQNYSSHTGFNYTFSETGTYLLELHWDTPVEGIKNNYTLRMVFNEIEINLTPNELYTVNDIFFYPGDQPNIKINIPVGNYQFKILELGSRNEWTMNFIEGYSDSWQNYYYTVIIIVPPFPIQVHNWKEQVYSKLVDQECSLILKLDKYFDNIGYDVGFIIRDYILSDDFTNDNLTNTFLNTDDFNYYKVNISENKFLRLGRYSDEATLDNAVVEILDDSFQSQGIWTINSSFTLEYTPTNTGIYYIKIYNNEENGDFILALEILEVTKKGEGFHWLTSLVGIITIEIVCIVMNRRKKPNK